ncbi:MAG: hypothetical protein QNJ63_30280 [Calothrix sp. MO_192.B10]|nr:hypothetical protein [Calothrix sp. MO_192.B10]
MKRRKFLTIFGTTLTVTVIGAAAVPGLKEGIYQKFYTWYKSAQNLPDAAPGSLKASTLQSLMATTEALLEDKLQNKSVYEKFFQWHAKKVPGYHELYEKFATILNQEAKKVSSRNFPEVDIATRRKIIDRVAMIPASSALPLKVENFRLTILERNKWYFDKFIVREIFQLFARTDALILIGYECWRTQPRGLNNYKIAPEQVAKIQNPQLSM